MLLDEEELLRYGGFFLGKVGVVTGFFFGEGMGVGQRIFEGSSGDE
jgi:hypothetical protein